MESLKNKCRRLGVDYHRAIKRRQAGHSDEKIFDKGLVRSLRCTNEITVYGVTYPNLKEAVRSCKPIASRETIGRLLKKGVSPDDAFDYVPNPGYANGIIYCVTHKESGKKYIGLTIQTLERRWFNHIEQAFGGYIKNEESLHSAIRRFGSSAFEINKLDNGVSKRGLEDKERHWIRSLNTLAPYGFNISTGGVSGGSNKKPVEIDGIKFESAKEAASYLSKSRGISFSAARKRISVNRIYAKKPARSGESLIKSKCYKVWSRIIHGALNPNSRDYIYGLDIHESWKDFDVFYNDVGNPSQESMAFSRLDKDLGFFPENCLWMTKSESSRINAAYMKRKGRLTGRNKSYPS